MAVGTIAAQVTTRYRWVTLGAVGFGWLISVMDRVTVSSLLPFIRADFNLDHAQVGLLGAVYLLSYAFAQFPAGLLSDRLGPKHTMFIGLFGTVLSFFTALVSGFVQLLIIRIVVAFGEGHCWVPGMRAQADWFPRQEKGRAAALLMTAGVGGLGLMPVLAGITIALTGNWRLVFYWLAGCAVISLIVLHRYFFNTPKDAVAADRMGFAELGHIRSGVLRQTGARQDVLRLVIRDKMLWVYSALLFFNMAVYYGVTTWLASFLYEQHSFNVAAMGLVAGLPYFVGILALLVGGWIVDKYGWVRLTIAASFALMIPILYMIAGVGNVVQAIVLLVALLGFFAHLSWTPIYSYQVRRYPKEMVGSAMGISNAIGMLGSFVSPLLTGFMVVSNDGGYSFHNVFILLMGFAAVASLIALFLRDELFQPSGSRVA